LMFGAPPPPIVYFAEAVLVMPGAVAGSPFALTGAILEIEWLAQFGLVLGAAFFWYCVGWHIDRARNIVQYDKAPAVVRFYLSALVVLSFLLFPVGLLAGIRLGVHSCGTGVPPYWAEVLGYGIMMTWISVGTFFGWRSFRDRIARRQPSTFLS